MDTDGDRRLTEAEWLRGCAIVGITISEEEARSAFRHMCVENHSHNNGYVLFGWFCEWCARSHCALGSERSPSRAAEPEPAEPEPEPPEPVVEELIFGTGAIAEPRSCKMQPRRQRVSGCGRQIDSVELVQELLLHAMQHYNGCRLLNGARTATHRF